jgi:hypothetical protein
MRVSGVADIEIAGGKEGKLLIEINKSAVVEYDNLY